MVKNDSKKISKPFSEWSKEELLNAVTYDRCSHYIETLPLILDELKNRNLSGKEFESIKEYQDKLNKIGEYELNSAKKRRSFREIILKNIRNFK